MNKGEWSDADFHRRHYIVESPDLDKAKRIELRIIVDGKVMVQTQAREPGIMAFVSKPKDNGFEIEIVEAGGARYTDIRTPAGGQSEPLAPWQKEALGL